MNLVLVLPMFLLGLAVGSFLNVLIDRLPKEESIISPPSHCDYCKRPLYWYDLIPVFSFIFLRGRCRYCQKPISRRYPVVEFLTGFFFVAIVLKTQFSLLSILDSMETIYHLIIISVFIVVFFTDLQYGIIPDKIVFPAIFLTAAYFLITPAIGGSASGGNHQLLITNYLPSALAAFLFFLAIYLLTQGRGMGFGDVKLSFLLGLFFGFPQIVAVLYTAFLTGAAFSIILILLGKKRLKETIVFGPFLVLASLFVLFFWGKIETIWFLPI